MTTPTNTTPTSPPASDLPATPDADHVTARLRSADQAGQIDLAQVLTWMLTAAGAMSEWDSETIENVLAPMCDPSRDLGLPWVGSTADEPEGHRFWASVADDLGLDHDYEDEGPYLAYQRMEFEQFQRDNAATLTADHASGAQSAPGRGPGPRWTVVGFWDDADRPVVVGVVPGAWQVAEGDDVSEGGPWALDVAAPDTSTAAALAVAQQRATLTDEQED